MTSCCSQKNVESFLREFLQGPVYPKQDFICKRVTFADVYAMASLFYATFKELEGSALPICLAAEERSTIAAALLAALASGKVLALPHSFSTAALQQMQESTGFKAAIVDTEYKRNLPQGTKLLSLDTASGNGTLPVSKISADAEWLLLFTGGSTGAPRIWSKTAGNIIAEAQFMAARYRICTNDIIAATVTPYHIYGLLFSVVIPLVASARVLAETPSFPAEIVALVQQESATILASVPVHYRALRGRQISASLRLAFSSAGMLEQEDNDDFCECNKAGVVEVYGSTETGGLATRNRSVGQEFFSPLEPVEWQIKEERLYVRSPFLSPDLSMNGDGFFLSGDRVQSRGDSEFSLHGRADAITKVGGERVDLDEVRDLLQSQPEVKECVVVSFRDETGRGNRIAALVRGDEIDLNQIKKSLARDLEPAALPKLIRKVDHIPVGSNGKYDREAIHTLLEDLDDAHRAPLYYFING